MSEDRQRLDKWLWYARFFKTRSLATRVCAASRVRINRVVVAKANAALKIGDVLTFPQGSRIRVVEVAALGERRGPATEARALYTDLAPDLPVAGQAAASVIAMEDEIIIRELQRLFHSGLFRVYTNTDLIGCELGGVLKNIIAIAVGMGDGQGAGDNTRSALITRGLSEIIRLGVAMGGRPETFAGLAGMGDLIATCTSAQSRNRHVGFELGKGRSLQEIIDQMVMVAEGVKSAPAVIALGEQYDVEMPVSRDVFSVLQGERTPGQIFRGLLKSSAGAESDPG